MTTKLLNSGKLKDYQAIGEDGILVWQRADAFRTSIINSPILGRRYADILALPKFSSDAAHVDWFIPFDSDRSDGEYEVVSWNAATLDEKNRAYSYLNDLKSKFLYYGMNLEASALSSNDKLFAHFLIGNSKDNIQMPAFQFPSDEYVYIVNGRPVITFWGFINHNSKPQKDPFFVLKREGAVYKTGSTANTAASTAATAATATATSFFAAHKWCLLLLPLLLLLLPLLAYLLWWLFFARSLPLFAVAPDLKNISLDPVKVEDTGYLLFYDDTDELVVKNRAYVSDDGSLVPVDEQNIPVDKEDTPVSDDMLQEQQGNLPLNQEDNSALPENEPSAKNDETQGANPPLLNEDGTDNSATDGANREQGEQGALPPPILNESNEPVLSNSDLNSGDISKLDGVWKVNSPIIEKNTNKPINLQYEFKDGKGKATIIQRDGVKCSGDVNGGLSSGSLTITNQSVAKCTDGSTYVLPSVKCSKGKDGKSSCMSEYDKSANTDQSKFPMELHR